MFTKDNAQALDLRFRDICRSDLGLPPFGVRSLCPACFGPYLKRVGVCFDGCFQIKTMKRGGYRTLEILPKDKRDERVVVYEDVQVVSSHSCLIARILKHSIRTKTNRASTSRPRPRRKWRRSLVTAALLLRCVGTISRCEYSTFEGLERDFRIRSAFYWTL